MVKMLEFFRNREKRPSNEVYNLFLIIFSIAGFIAAIDSLFCLNKPIYAQIYAVTENEMFSNIGTGVICICYLIVVDYALFKFLPESLKGLFSGSYKKNKSLLGLYFGTLVFCFLQTFVTVWISLNLRHTAAEMTLAPPTLADPNTAITVISKAMDEAKESDKDNKGAIERSRKNEVAKVYSNRELNKLAASGNGWAKQKISGMLAEVNKRFDSKAENVGSKTSSQLAELNKVARETVAAVKAKNDFEQRSYDRKVNSLADFLLYFSLAATAIQWYCSAMIALYFAGFNVGTNNFEKGLVATNKPNGVQTQNVATNDPKTAQNSVATQKTNGFLAEWKQLKKGIQAEIGNLRDGNGDRNTVKGRLGEKIDAACNMLNDVNYLHCRAEIESGLSSFDQTLTSLGITVRNDTFDQIRNTYGVQVYRLK